MGGLPNARKAARGDSFAAWVRSWLADNCELRDREGRGDAEIDTSSPEVVARGRRFQAALFDAGLAGISWPREFGGQGRSLRDEHAFAMESAPYVLPNRVLSIGLGMCGPTILARGTNDQRHRYIRPLLCGREAWAQLFSEPGAGSDLGSIATKAVKDGDSWIVTGQKVWSSGAHFADFGLLLARTAEGSKASAFSMFVLDMTSPGVEVRPLREMTGESRFNEVFFDGVRLPHAAVVGGEGDGWSVAMTTLTSERFSIAGSAFAARAGTVAHLVDLAHDRGVSTDLRVRQRLADLWIRERLVALMMQRATENVLAGRRAGPEGALAKLMTSRLMRDVATCGLDLSGVSGLVGVPPAEVGLWSKRLMMVVGLSIAGGTDEILKNTVGERVLKLPREPRTEGASAAPKKGSAQSSTATAQSSASSRIHPIALPVDGNHLPSSDLMPSGSPRSRVVEEPAAGGTRGG